MKRVSVLLVVVLACLFLSMQLAAATVSCTGVSAWAVNKSYSVGSLVTYSGSEYKCLQAHTSETGWEPPNVPALWSLVGTCSSGGSTPTPTPKATATATPKGTATATPKGTATATPKGTATATPKPTATATPKPTATATPSGLNPNVAPGGNFNLSVWELQEPFLDSSGNVNTILSSQLEGPNGYQDKYFYTSKSDGAMTFFCPEDGQHTPNSSYPRSELREMNSDGTASNWAVAGTNIMSASLKVINVTDHTAIGQIHIGSAIKSGVASSTKPLLELFYFSSGEVSLYIEQTPAGGNEVPHSLGTVPLGQKFSYTIELDGSGEIKMTLNGVTSTFTMPSGFYDYGMYFKAGDYLQTTGSSSTVGAEVAFYSLKVSHQ